MSRRAGTIVACFVVALACGASLVAAWHHRMKESTAPSRSRAARAASEARPTSERLPPAAPPPRDNAPPPAASAAVPSNSRAEAGFDEEELMRLLRSARDSDPELTAELAREGNRRFPESPDAPERASILIHALAEQGLSAEARGEAEDMVNRYPDSPWVREIERFTGAHRHRNIRVGQNGELHYVDPPPPS